MCDSMIVGGDRKQRSPSSTNTTAITPVVGTGGRYGELDSVYTEICDEPTERRKAISAESLPPVSKSE